MTISIMSDFETSRKIGLSWDWECFISWSKDMEYGTLILWKPRTFGSFFKKILKTWTLENYPCSLREVSFEKVAFNLPECIAS